MKVLSPCRLPALGTTYPNDLDISIGGHDGVAGPDVTRERDLRGSPTGEGSGHRNSVSAWQLTIPVAASLGTVELRLATCSERARGVEVDAQARNSQPSSTRCARSYACDTFWTRVSALRSWFLL